MLISKKFLLWLLVVSYPLSIYQLEIFSVNVRLNEIVILFAFFLLLITSLATSSLPVPNLLAVGALLIVFSGLFSELLNQNFDILSLKGLLRYIFFFLSAYILSWLITPLNLNFLDSLVVKVSVFIATIILVQQLSYVLFDFKWLYPFCDILPCADVAYRERHGAWGYAGGFMRPPALFTSLNYSGLFLIPSLLSLYGRILLGEKKAKKIFLFIFIALLLSLAKNALAAFTIAIIFFSLKFYKFSFSFLRVAALLGILIFGVMIFFEVEVILKLTSQLELWLDHIQSSAIVLIENYGFGLGFQKYDSYVFETGLVDKYGSHNNFISTLGDTGIIGIIGFLLPIFFMHVLIKNSLRLLKRSKIDRDFILFLAYTSSFVGLFVAGFIRTYYLNFWSVLIFTIALSYYKVFKHKVNK
jgi:hypothetical protein